ncbi:MAG: bifunctional precorrin-2 dehydrogenase/sirohydrochlorin ferrochelatase [Thermoplasmata archaeon]
MYLPIMLKIDKLKITVFGGGKVALRKIKLFEGADITVISESVDEEVKKIAKNIIYKRIMEENDVIEYIKNSNFLIISTDNKEINKRLMMLCEKENKIYNAVDDRESVSIFPSFFKENDIIVAFSTSGKAPAIARLLKEKARLYSKALDVIEKIRGEISHDELKRREFFDTLLKDDKFLYFIENGDNVNAYLYSIELWRNKYETN